MITSSELGLFIQQKVGQASESKQTPDFGAFDFDDRGEMVISLRNQSFDALKARAFSALQKGEVTSSKELIEELISIRPIAPETLYIKYKLSLIENDIDKAWEIIKQLDSLINFSEGIIPLSRWDISDLYYTLPCWKPMLAIKESEFPVNIKVRNGKSENELIDIETKMLGELNGYCVQNNTITQFVFDNRVDYPLYIYMVNISSSGKIKCIPLWSFNDLPYVEGSGFRSSKPLKVFNNGLDQLRFFVSPNEQRFFLSLPVANMRALETIKVPEEVLKDIKVQFLNIFIV